LRVNSLINSFNYALEGLIHTLKTQRNMKIHLSVAFLILLSSLFLDISRMELLILFFAIVFVIAMELVNTAVEVVIDMISEEYRFQARIAKNVAAAAVLMAAINAIVTGYLILLDDLRSVELKLIHEITGEESHLIFINLGLLLIIIMALKSKRGSGTPLRGGMPSGHSAIAFSLTTIIILLTGDVIIATLAILMAFMVIQSRLESRTHNWLEVITGALIGFALTVILFYLL
jgi:diacylglycerol kinase (ATP)